ncbi:hypothetical protein [Moorena sp. SIO3H5]|uniref:hypothetical protein n=1 Tax=Moorena sp. SIO3H5 TaxID=2607834 RepID=UPI0013BE0A6F|nr:hypothetical protein [Moorena sp. SIO3H5]NEO71705.1 hypothetical protein [Moorena sp. SIO3H5]
MKKLRFSLRTAKPLKNYRITKPDKKLRSLILWHFDSITAYSNNKVRPLGRT